MDLPILYYIRKVGCPACNAFQNQWEKLIQDPYLKDKLTFIEYTYSGRQPLPFPLTKYGTWFPSIILFNSQSYNSIFTPDGKLAHGYTEYLTIGGDRLPHMVKGIKYNAQLNDRGEYVYAGKENSHLAIKYWIASVYDIVQQM